MDFRLNPLPYPISALEPTIGRETMRLHHDKHEAAYLKKLEALIGGKPEAKESLEWLVRVAEGSVFDNAAQVWNHEFYWRSMHPDGGGSPPGDFAQAIADAFDGFDSFRGAFLEAGKSHFGSGWLWLVSDEGRLRITTTQDADLPLCHGGTPLLTCDLWEHAYYLDYRNERPRYLEAFLDSLANWEFAAANWGNGAAVASVRARRCAGG